MVRRRYSAWIVLWALTAVWALLPLSSSGAIAQTSSTGDITAPRFLSFTAEPTAVDVTDGDGQVRIAVHVTDEGSGLREVSPVNVTTASPTGQPFSASLVQVSGDSRDARFEGTLPVPQGSAPGEYLLYVSAGDRAGNQASYGHEQLKAAGWPHALQVESRGADTTGPTLVDLQLLTASVDARDGGATATVRVRVTDAGAGVQYGYVNGHLQLNNRSLSALGPVELLSGDTHDGWWQIHIPVPQYLNIRPPQGSLSTVWSLALSFYDQQNNRTVVDAAALAARGLPSQVQVQALYDEASPVLSDLQLSANSLDVSQEDQVLTLTMTVRDSDSGLMEDRLGHFGLSFDIQRTGSAEVDVQASFSDTQRRLWGDAALGRYVLSLTVPRSSATGQWDLGIRATDVAGNTTTLYARGLPPYGLPETVHVYNTPLPPVEVVAHPADQAAIIEWQPPVDDRGAVVSEYVVTDLTTGRLARAGADTRRIRVDGLTNGVRQRFTVRAVNRAGASEASAAAETIPSADAPAPTTVQRLAGADRIATAVSISRSQFPDRSTPSAVLARSDDFADALAGVPLAHGLSGPMLLTNSGGLSTGVLTELQRVVSPGGSVYLLGGERALSPAITTTLRARGFNVIRLAGTDRYDTAVRIATWTRDRPTKVLLATGRSFADALSAGTAAAHAGGVLVLTDDRRLPAVTAQYLAANRQAIVYAAGGAAAAAVPSATALAGADRYATAVAVAKAFAWSTSHVGIASGERFPDALAGGAHAAGAGGPLLLTPGARLPVAVTTHLRERLPDRITVYGGASTVTDVVLGQLRNVSQ